jgi:hypothetical protein
MSFLNLKEFKNLEVCSTSLNLVAIQAFGMKIFIYYRTSCTRADIEEKGFTAFYVIRNGCYF